MARSTHALRVVLACVKKELRTARTERVFTFIMLVIPLEYLALLSLFLLAANHAPTAVVMNDTGPQAEALYTAMGGVHTFSLDRATAADAKAQLQSGRIVAIVTIPSDFDTRVAHSQPVTLPVVINNLNTDFTEDIRRGVPLAITTFYAHARPKLVNVVANERDAYPRDLAYTRYVAVSILVVGLLVVGIAQAGTSWAREWELQTVRELLMSPTEGWMLIAGKMLGTFLLSLASVGVVLGVLIGVAGIWPAHWGAVVGYVLLIVALAVAIGTLIGALARQRRLVTTLLQGFAIPVFFLSGPLAPVSYNTPAIQAIARLLPIEYAIAALQHAFYSYRLNTLDAVNAVVLAGFGAACVAAALLVLHRATVPR